MRELAVPDILGRATARLRRLLGMDGAIAFTVFGRMLNIIGSTGTVLFIVKFLNSIEQGYYYTLLSVGLLQTLFELGFSFVIQQLAAHESVLCNIGKDGRITGDRAAHSRLASILQLTIRWYFRAALAMVVVVLPVGVLFFSRGPHAADGVHWVGPWVTLVLASAAYFFVTPVFSFLEGCNQVREVAQLRFLQALAVIAGSWGALVTGHGLYAPTMVNVGVLLVGFWFLWNRRQLLLQLLRYPTESCSISWRKEVWPFQWKLATSWLCNYLTTSIFTPLVFLLRGPEEAGRLGLSLSVAGYLPIMALAWITTKATAFGQLVSLRKFDELDRLFFSALKHGFVLMCVMIAGCMCTIFGLSYSLPRIAGRMETPTVFSLLLLTGMSTFFVQSMAIYLRSFKQEPFLIQSATVAVLVVLGVLFAGPRWGSIGIVIAYAMCMGMVGIISAASIFQSKRSRYLNGEYTFDRLQVGAFEHSREL